jgi:hypothetical protein
VSRRGLRPTFVVGQGRVELPTSRLSGVRSNHLSYWPGGPRRARSLETESYAWQCERCQLIWGFDPKSPSKTELFGSMDCKSSHGGKLLRKEVIQPQVPLRLPCYDFTPVTVHSLGTCLSCELAQPLLEQTTPMV